MSGHHPFSKLRKRMTPARCARNARTTRRMLADMTLHELRQERERSQENLARRQDRPAGGRRSRP